MSLSLVLLVAVVASGSLCDASMTNSWAVQVPKGDRAADVAAKKHGFVNIGRVSCLTKLTKLTKLAKLVLSI